jgi:hypothetical protein
MPFSSLVQAVKKTSPIYRNWRKYFSLKRRSAGRAQGPTGPTPHNPGQLRHFCVLTLKYITWTSKNARKPRIRYGAFFPDDMRSIGKYFDRQIYWLDYDKFPNQLPDKDWVCLATANHPPDIKKFDEFVRTSIAKGILEFKGHGNFGEKLHDLFDEIMVVMETMEEHAEIGVMTTWHNDETLADVFWQCFFATCLPETTDFDNIKIVCTDIDGIDRSDDLKAYIKEFELGWLPSDNVKHQVWKDPAGLTTLCLADYRGNDCRNLIEPGSKIIYEFYADSHFDAMTTYYKYMGWGTYTTEFEIDKEPYDKKNAP